MTPQEERLHTALVELIKKHTPTVNLIGTVASVDLERMCCKIEVQGDAPYHGVQLRPIKPSNMQGLVHIPKIGSEVVFSQIDVNESWRYISLMSEIEKVMYVNESGVQFEMSDVMKLNGDQHGGLAIVSKLVKQINAIEERLNLMQSIFNTHVHPSSGVVTPSKVLGKSLKTIESDIENPSVKHG